MQSKTANAPAKAKNLDAIALLKQDHRDAESLFESYEKAKDDKLKADLSAKICQALSIHMNVEEELFYPASRKATGDDDLLDEALVEHAGAKQLIAEIEDMKVGDGLYDAKIKVLSEQIEHHLGEEEKELFPEVKKSELDLQTLGKQFAARKAKLMAGQK